MKEFFTMRFACNSDFLKTHTFRTDSDFLTPNSRYYKIRPQTNKSNRIQSREIELLKSSLFAV
ncbi:hypothetical protein B2G51_08970 [Leptospira santarosai]|nr:hypothetical protein B2G51_08970 [Leptospira santarosai]